MRKSRRLSKMKSGMSMVPMINVAFFIMLMLMKISPFLNEAKVEVDVPQATSNEEQEDKEVTLILTSKMECVFEGKVVKFSELNDYLKNKTIDTSQVFVIKADKDVPYLWIKRAIKIGKMNKFKRIAIATRKVEEEGEGQE